MTDSELVSKGPCDKCGSSDACCTYDDGHTHCFSCGKNSQHPSTDHTQAPRKATKGGLITSLKFKDLDSRGLREETLKRYGYGIGTMGEKGCQVAPYHDATGTVVAQKVRFADKSFTVVGDGKAIGKLLFGAHLWRTGGKRIVITEGEIDALSVAQALGSWPAVSIPNGAQGAKKALQANLEWLETYDEVVLWFDNDEPGREAVEECVTLFSPGKVKVVRVAAKDANDMLKSEGAKAVLHAVWEAKAWRPDGVVNASDTLDLVLRPVARGLSYPWKGLDEMTCGIMPRQIITVAAGTGVGKSAICGELGTHLLATTQDIIGHVALEESNERTVRGYVGRHLNVPIHIPGREAKEADVRAAHAATVGGGRLYIYDSFGSLESDVLMSRLRYMVKVGGAKVLILDHVSIMVSGLELDNERKALDVVMTRLRSFTEETGCSLVLVTHLKRVDGGKSHEEGGEVSLSHLRGSQAIAQLSDVVIGAERDQQADDHTERNTTRIRVLKNRVTGETGLACELLYNRETGRLSEKTGDSSGEDVPWD